MQFRQLEYFVALARERHFARAASACYVSQPALSEAIRKLEHELGVPLVLRGSNFEGLTPEGDRLVLWARRILADRDALEHEVTALRSGLTGELRLGVVPGAATRVALMADALCAEHPLVRVRIESSLRSVEILDRIRRFELDAGVVYDDGLQTDGLELTRLYEERYVLVAGDGLLRDAHDPIDWSEALSLPMCLLHKGMRDRDRIDEAAAEHGLVVSPRLEADSVATLLALVGTGRWAAIVARTWFATAAPPAGTRTVELQAPTLGSPVALVRAAGDPASLLARALAQVVAPPDQP
ncbi:LysR family transcriptional regulator [Mycobacteroides abscessus]|uniref:LysR family transcriptional regulator n=1 Tax=Mycobacteroides abscessus TaxID=36809 RepID=UPI00092987D9|nr:LysR family transcriptional regulator [Mycobacteroides abscessus]SHR18907.1 Transcriptional regulator, LysR family [Mycobacteroides abscessus subsp. bolletii]SHS71225.1 Transcriptional regulator, LysR family [Mycobacteroides abscessus subsp. bolletii]SHS89646.1 Transcriptional regulator, LysR family [Mycobacteroides abscessus subsp. bolletii]SKG48893.1 Transcriptional regulator, LysR family [Mycobacteroides abscessus subsp. bolletii]SKH11470.1 Transcriptional regulator, LysR family [Mycobac